MTIEMIEKCRELSDAELIKDLKFLAEREKRNLANLLAHLAEFDKRRLAQKEHHPSLFWYCVRVLHYDEGGAYRRIHAARVIQRYPLALPSVADGSLGLTSLLLLSPILNENNHVEVFNEAKGKTKRDVELIVVKHDPRPPLPDSMRRLPAPPPPWEALPPRPSPQGYPKEELEMARSGGQFVDAIPPTPPREWQAIVPLTMERVRIGFDAAIGLVRLVERARQVLRHKYPDGRLEDVMKEALEILLDRKDPQRRLTLKTPAIVHDVSSEASPNDPRLLRDSKSGRYIPAWVKRIVWERDDGRCAWRFEDGTLCGSRDWTEFDHIKPIAQGGRSGSPRNVRLLCRLHNIRSALAAGVNDAAGSA